MRELDYQKLLDVQGLRCPLPILRTKRVLNQMKSGEVLKIITTDPASRIDLGAFAYQTGHFLLSVIEENGVFTFFIQHK